MRGTLLPALDETRNVAELLSVGLKGWRATQWVKPCDDATLPSLFPITGRQVAVDWAIAKDKFLASQPPTASGNLHSSIVCQCNKPTQIIVLAWTVAIISITQLQSRLHSQIM